MVTPQKGSPRSCHAHFAREERAYAAAAADNTMQNTQRDSYIFPMVNSPMSHSQASDAWLPPALHTLKAEPAATVRSLDADLKCQAQQHTVDDKQLATAAACHCSCSPHAATRQQQSNSLVPKPHRTTQQTSSRNKLHTTPSSKPPHISQGSGGKTPAPPASESPASMLIPLLPRAELVSRMKAAEKRSHALQMELTFCQERLRAATEHLQIANEGQARALERADMFQKQIQKQHKQMGALQGIRQESDAESSQLQAEMSLERGTRLLEEREREEERERHHLQILKLGSEISTLKLAARQPERQRKLHFCEYSVSEDCASSKCLGCEQLQEEVVALRGELIEAQRVHVEELMVMQVYVCCLPIYKYIYTQMHTDTQIHSDNS